MARLIDADKFRRYAHEQLELDKTYTADEILEMIDQQPTAYDVEKVVEELEEYANSKICWNHHGCPYQGNSKVYCENCGALGALEIVRKGGLE